MQASTGESRHMNTTKTEKIHPAGLGRGSNPRSRKNLKPQPKNCAVFQYDVNTCSWKQMSRNTTFRNAYDWAAKLEAHNHSNVKPLYISSIVETK